MDNITTELLNVTTLTGLGASGTSLHFLQIILVFPLFFGIIFIIIRSEKTDICKNMKKNKISPYKTSTNV
jgi:hypothetical protein